MERAFLERDRETEALGFWLDDVERSGSGVLLLDAGSTGAGQGVRGEKGDQRDPGERDGTGSTARASRSLLSLRARTAQPAARSSLRQTVSLTSATPCHRLPASPILARTARFAASRYAAYMPFAIAAESVFQKSCPSAVSLGCMVYLPCTWWKRVPR